MENYKIIYFPPNMPNTRAEENITAAGQMTARQIFQARYPQAKIISITKN